MDLYHNNHSHDIPEAAKHAREQNLSEEEELFMRYLQQEVLSTSYAPSAKPSNNPTDQESYTSSHYGSCNRSYQFQLYRFRRQV